MDPKTIAAAKAIPNQFKELVGALFDESKGALKQGVGSLRQSLGRIESFLDQVEKESLAGETTKKTTRSRGRFPIADFVMSQLEENPKGLRPKDIAAALKQEAPGAHKDPNGVVSNTLSRMGGLKRVVNRSGLWKLATSTKPGSKATKKKASQKKTARSNQKTATKTAKLFPISKFVLDRLASGKKPMRAAEIAAKLTEAAPGKHADASRAVHNTLARLKEQGKVKRLKNGWRVA